MQVNADQSLAEADTHRKKNYYKRKDSALDVEQYVWLLSPVEWNDSRQNRELTKMIQFQIITNYHLPDESSTTSTPKKTNRQNSRETDTDERNPENENHSYHDRRNQKVQRTAEKQTNNTDFVAPNRVTLFIIF